MSKHNVCCGETICEQVCIPVGCIPPACCLYLPAYTGPGCEQNLWHTLLKILPCPNFIVGCNHEYQRFYTIFWSCHYIWIKYVHHGGLAICDWYRFIQWFCINCCTRLMSWGFIFLIEVRKWRWILLRAILRIGSVFLDKDVYLCLMQ